MSEYLREFTLAVARANGIGPRTFTQLCAEFGGVEKVQQSFSANALSAKLQASISESIHQNWTAELQKHGLNYICVWENDYPEALKQIADPPIVLFYVGNWQRDLFQRTISIVGSRAATQQGKTWTQSLVAELVAERFTIISGMAFGIDAASHLAAIKAGGHTVAALASAAYEPSPARNKYIYDAILANGGLIVSETFPGEEMVPGLFAKRNRIIAGLGQATVVVEADRKSGALITAELAGGYGRQVFAIPGEPERQMSRGCNQLIKQSKAMLIESGTDILQELGIVQVSLAEKTAMTCEKEQKLAKIDPSARIIYDKLQVRPLYLEQICGETGKQITEIISILSDLQVLGLVLQTEIGEYKIV